MNTQILTTCDGTINYHGICMKCCQPAQTSSIKCGRLVQSEQLQQHNVMHPFSPAVAKQILLVRDALALGDVEEAYHQLYKIASPDMDKLSDEVWKELETVAGEYGA